MPKSIEIEDLATEIANQLATYDESVEIVVTEEIEAMAKTLVKELKNDPNVPQNTGYYKKHFYMKKYGKQSKRRGYVIANKDYQLTHLLEYGHATRNGGRTRAFPHWAQANRKAQETAINIRKRLEGQQ